MNELLGWATTDIARTLKSNRSAAIGFKDSGDFNIPIFAGDVDVKLIKNELLETLAKYIASYRRHRIGRNYDEAYFDPAGRWEGGEIYEEGDIKDLIARDIRAMKTP